MLGLLCDYANASGWCNPGLRKLRQLGAMNMTGLQKTLAQLPKHFPGVYVDLSWGWSIDPLSVVDFLRRAIHTIPSNKVLGFGGDSFSPVESVGYARQAREWLLRALHGEIADGLLDAAGALDLARRWMGASQAELFDLDGTRAALRERIGDGSADEPGVSADALELVAAALTA